MEKRLLLILNPRAGQKRANRFLPDIIRLYNDLDFECACYVTSGIGDATRYVRENAARFDNIVCIGGDGTLNETITGLLESGADSMLGYIPAGSTNDYARSLGLSSDIMTAAKDAVCGELHSFDLGLFNGRSFITYDDPMSMSYKAKYVLEKGVRGIMYWEHSSDKTGMLFNAIYENLFPTK